MYRQGVRDGFLVHLYLVGIVDDDVELSVHVGDGLSVTRVPQQLHGICDDGLVRVDVSLTSRRGHCIDEPSEARDGIVLNDLIHVRHLETVVHIPSQQRRGEQDLITSKTAHEHATRSRHDVVLLGVSAHERAEIVACQTDVLEHGLHLGKVFALRFRYAKVTLDQTEHGSGTHATQDLLRRHRPLHVTSSWKCSIHTPLYNWISFRLFPLAFPQLDDLDKVTEVDGVLSGLGKQLGHGFPVDLVDLFTSARVTMEKTSMVLISRVRLAAPPVHQQFAYCLLSTVDLVSYDASRAFGFPSQPFRSHLSIQLRRFGSEVVLFPSSRVPSHRHVLHE